MLHLFGLGFNEFSQCLKTKYYTLEMVTNKHLLFSILRKNRTNFQTRFCNLPHQELNTKYVKDLKSCGHDWISVQICTQICNKSSLYLCIFIYL